MDVQAQGSFGKWSTRKEDYELLDVIGTGATSVVTSALYKPRGDRVAIKRINLEKCNTTVEELLKEIQVMSQCNHENVLPYYASFVNREELWLVIKLCSVGSLLDIIKELQLRTDVKHGVLDEATIATVLREVLKGLDYFHSQGQIHRDIKAGNILLCEDGSIYIADFGVSAFLAIGTRDKVRHTFVGTPCWMAPEVIDSSGGYDLRADIWSLGITAIELVTGAAPYHNYPPMKVLMMTLQNEPPTLESCSEERDQYHQYGKSLRRFIADCLRKEPEKRPTAKALLKHDFLKKAKDKEYLVRSLVTVWSTSTAGQAHAAAAGVNSNSSWKATQKVRRVPGTSGRLHRTEDGGWEWSDEELAPDSLTEPERKELQTLRSPRLKDSEPAITVVPAAEVHSASARKKIIQISLVLRLRNEGRELHDIKFDFQTNQDSSDSVSRELVEANLIDGRDMIVVAANLQKMVDNPVIGRSNIFALSSPLRQNEVADDQTLVGYASLSISDMQYEESSATPAAPQKSASQSPSPSVSPTTSPIHSPTSAQASVAAPTSGQSPPDSVR